MLEAVLLKLHAKLAPGWVLIRVNFDPIQEIGPKVGGAWTLFRERVLFCETTVRVFCAAAGQSEIGFKMFGTELRIVVGLHQILAGNVITWLEPLLNCQCSFKFWGCGYTRKKYS